MIITQVSPTERELARRGYRDTVEIKIDGSTVLEFPDGEPEDNNMSRNFNDIYGIVNVLKQVHAAGVAGESLAVIFEEVGE
ncbi:hypothetical protein LCGC14_2359510 [marine sediment metagenome]|uniref:Uncharacterized protein n=1 Tax=marine sediment metagenome TaxID=412755 RepID=A0A0F9F1V9_9ZZZZ